MACSQVYRCGCGQRRGKNNHWFAARTAPFGAIYLYKWDVAGEMGILDDPHTVHLCGQRCAVQLTETWMTAKAGQ